MALSFILWNVKYNEQLEQVCLKPHFLQIKYGAKPLLLIKKSTWSPLSKYFFTKFIVSFAINLFFILSKFKLIILDLGKG